MNLRQKMKKKINKSHDDRDRLSVRKFGRTIYFYADIDEDSVCEANRLISELENESLKKPIEIIFNSNGGNCYDGLALYDKIRSSDCEMITVANGLVASMAVVAFLAGDKRVVTEHARFMNHKTSASIEADIDIIESDARETRLLEELILEIMSDRTGKPIKELRKEIRIGNRYISAEEAIEEGYADEMIENKRTIRRRRKKKK